MANGVSPRSSGRSGPSVSVDAFLDTKLSRPPVRRNWVPRERLLDQLDEAVTRPLTLLAAPAGFGKTTVLAQWLARRTSGTACWVSLDSGDNDPTRLWSHVVIALERAGCLQGREAAAFVAASSTDISGRVLPRLVRDLAATEGVVILLDDFHFVREPDCHEHMKLLVQHLPPHVHLLIATRSDPGLRLGRMRANGMLSEIRAADLAFTAGEARALVEQHGVRLTSSSMSQLLERTEGWPAGLYLAALSLSGQEQPAEFVHRFSGTSQFVGDYLTEEVLARHTDEMRAFITSMSILDRMCAPLCDFITGTSEAAANLRELERTNLFLIPMDEHGGWYRFHHLFASAARGELEMKDPARVPGLHVRAATWFGEHGYIDEAIRHLVQAGRNDQAARLVQTNWIQYVTAGRAATVSSWLASLSPTSVADAPAAGATAAWLAAITGDEAALAALLEALEEVRDYGPLPDGTVSVESAIVMIRALFGFDGALTMMAAARRAVELETDGRSPNYAIASLGLGHAAYVQGDLQRAAELLAKATNSAAAPPLIQVVSAATYSLVEAEWGHGDRARELAQDAMGIVDACDLAMLPQAGLAFTALAQVQALDGRLEAAWRTVQHCLTIRRRHPTLSPWATMHHLFVAARVASDAGNRATAEQLLDEAETLMTRFSGGMDRMYARLAAIRDLAPPSAPVAVEPLTDREADILRLLEGSLNLREIAAELYVSHNTVKTHIRALYRKLGARSRTEAVQLARGRHLT
jgi:LuxR family transcriptional regulator, maltose regulon positive regulatory protein